jgi:hypothetical protein
LRNAGAADGAGREAAGGASAKGAALPARGCVAGGTKGRAAIARDALEASEPGAGSLCAERSNGLVSGGAPFFGTITMTDSMLSPAGLFTANCICTWSAEGE